MKKPRKGISELIADTDGTYNTVLYQSCASLLVNMVGGGDPYAAIYDLRPASLGGYGEDYSLADRQLILAYATTMIQLELLGKTD